MGPKAAISEAVDLVKALSALNKRWWLIKNQDRNAVVPSVDMILLVRLYKKAQRVHIILQGVAGKGKDPHSYEEKLLRAIEDTTMDIRLTIAKAKRKEAISDAIKPLNHSKIRMAWVARTLKELVRQAYSKEIARG